MKLTSTLRINTRKTECGAKLSLTPLAERAAPFALFAFALLATLPLTAQRPAADNDPDRAVKGSGFPAGWSVRPDRGNAAQINFTESGGVSHFVMGPAGTFYNAQWTKTGDYKYSARVAQTKAPSHPTSYGIMFGGSDMAGAGQTYSYFLVRGQGDYFIANRDGADRPATVVDWTPNAAIAKQGADGKQANALGIQVLGDNVIFSVNGKEVTRLAKSKVHTNGLIGYRIGHNMDVDIDQVTK